MSSDLEIPFDRVTYRDGQLLDARDMGDDRLGDARLRWLHTCYLHGTWGIALGLEVSKGVHFKKNANGNVETVEDNRKVTVKPGYAIDRSGREILLAETIRLSVPNSKEIEQRVLTVSYQGDAAFLARSDLQNICLGDGLDLRNERPEFHWRRVDEVQFGPEVPLVHVNIKDGTIVGQLSNLVRRNARRLVRPHVGWGKTEPEVGWIPWSEGASGLGWQVTVDTSEAGFTGMPLYFAILHIGSDDDHTDGNGEHHSFFLDGPRFIVDATPKNFTYRIMFDDRLPYDPLFGGIQNKASVSWFGLEPVAGCEPASSPLFSLRGDQLDRILSFFKHI